MEQELISQSGAQKAVALALDIGAAMLTTGADSTRVEDTINRICRAYGARAVDAFSITSLVIVTFHMDDTHSVTQTKRVRSYSIDLDKLELLNAVSRDICKNTPDMDVIRKRYQDIMQDRPSYFWKMLLGYILAAVAFAVFFGGTLLDGAVAGIPAFFLFFLDWYLKKKSKNKIVYTFFTSFLVGVLTMLIAVCIPQIHEDKVMIGNIMLLIPGIHFMNSVKDMLCGDTMTGLLRLVESILTAVAIATAFAGAILLFRSFL